MIERFLTWLGLFGSDRAFAQRVVADFKRNHPDQCFLCSFQKHWEEVVVPRVLATRGINLEIGDAPPHRCEERLRAMRPKETHP